jgi:hypothetical protein
MLFVHGAGGRKEVLYSSPPPHKSIQAPSMAALLNLCWSCWPIFERSNGRHR